MGTPYETAPSWVVSQIKELVRKEFPDLEQAYFLVWFDTQKRTDLGRIKTHSISKPSAKILHSLDDEYDYLIILDRLTFENIEAGEQLTMLYSLLARCKTETKAEEPKFALRGPDYSITKAEMKFNAHWRETLDNIQAKAAEVHETQPSVPENNPDAPHMFNQSDEESEAA